MKSQIKKVNHENENLKAEIIKMGSEFDSLKSFLIKDIQIKMRLLK